MSYETKLTVETSGEKTFGPCDCCGQITNRVWGFIHEADTAVAAYFVEWTPGHEAGSSAFDLIIGTWGVSSTNDHRQAVSLEFRKLESGPAFMVVDASTRAVAKSPLISQALSRSEVIGEEIAARAYAICDAIYLEDTRLSWTRE